MATKQVYQLYAELKDYRPTIWRRFEVDSNILNSRLRIEFSSRPREVFCILGLVRIDEVEFGKQHTYCVRLVFTENVLQNQVGG